MKKIILNFLTIVLLNLLLHCNSIAQSQFPSISELYFSTSKFRTTILDDLYLTSEEIISLKEKYNFTELDEYDYSDESYDLYFEKPTGIKIQLGFRLPQPVLMSSADQHIQLSFNGIFNFNLSSKYSYTKEYRVDNTRDQFNQIIGHTDSVFSSDVIISTNTQFFGLQAGYLLKKNTQSKIGFSIGVLFGYNIGLSKKIQVNKFKYYSILETDLNSNTSNHISGGYFENSNNYKVSTFHLFRLSLPLIGTYRLAPLDSPWSIFSLFLAYQPNYFLFNSKDLNSRKISFTEISLGLKIELKRKGQ